MDRKKKDIPVFRQLIGRVKKGFATLDEKSQNEVKAFVKSCRHPDGGFTDRAGHPDSYYSLFGAWLSSALDLQLSPDTQSRWSPFSPLQNPKEKPGPADAFASLLIQVLISENDFKKPSVLQLFKMAFRDGRQVSVFYRLFLFLLAFDALYKKKIMYLFARMVFFFYAPPSESPCSIYAAVMVARHEAGLKTYREKEELLSYFEEGKGFKAFREVNEADLLSTAVALFAMEKTQADLRLVAPGCLRLIQQNYDEGAFLAGNGDEARDLEYTFYGLMALGTLV